jgi:Flp pilus assembly protein CpaB
LKRSNRLVLLIGIFLALIAFVLVIVMLGGGGGSSGDRGRPTPTPSTGNVVVATKNIDLGATIQADQVGLKEIPLTSKPADSFGDTSLVIGQTARSSVTAGQLITSATLSDTGAVKKLDVPPGMVAMSVKVNQVSGVGTVIKTGDYVDAIVAFNILPSVPDPVTGLPKQVTDFSAGPSVKALLQGMQVLGTLLPTPAQAEPTPVPEGSPASGGGGSSTSLNDQEQVVILAVTLQQAEVLNYSQITGVVAPNGMTLVLRSSKDYVDASGAPSIPPDTQTTGVVLSILVEQYGVLPPAFYVDPLATPAPSKSPRG